MDFAKEAIETLRRARFPAYAVSPSEWQGDVMIRGWSGGKKRVLAIRMSYEDDIAVERPDRQIQIVSTGAEGMSKRSPTDSFLLFEASYEMEIVNFVNNISSTRLPEDRNGVSMAGPRRPLPAAQFRSGLFLDGAGFEDHPELRLYRLQAPHVEVLFMGWNFGDDTLIAFARKARPIQEDGELLEEIERAEYSASEKINNRRHR